MNHSKRILFYPEIPDDRTVIAKICKSLGYSYSNKLTEDYTFGFKWKDQTYYTLDSEFISNIGNLKIFNTKCTDISKSYVYETYSAVFDHILAVNPLVYSGSIVSKSDINAKHDGAIFQGPITEIDPEKSYSILIDNSDGDEVIDYRVPIFLDRIPIVSIKRRKIITRFENENTSVSLAYPEEVFDPDEIENLLTFANKLGMEYGELDVLRDKKSKHIYVIDANNTPFGPPSGLPEKDSNHLLEVFCKCFKETFIAQAY